MTVAEPIVWLFRSYREQLMNGADAQLEEKSLTTFLGNRNKVAAVVST